MRLRRFEAATMTEALARVKADLGPEAVILHARTTGPAGDTGPVEVTAAVDDDRPPATPRAASGWGGRGAGSTGAPTAPAVPGGTQRPSRAVTAVPTVETLETWDAGPAEAERLPGALEDIRDLLLELRAEVGPSPKIPASLRSLYRHLLAQEVPASVARQLILTLPEELRVRRKALDPGILQDLWAKLFRVSGPIAPGRQQRAVALVGPTGVGKTTTIAKLAGQLRHSAGLRVALISLDTYRIGAVAQMQIYADLLGISLRVVRTPAEMQAALRAERGADLLLLDTTGRSPRQAEGIAATRRLLRQIPDLEVHLVVSATTKGTDLAETLRRFRSLDYRRVLVTKLDEARSPGPLLSLAVERELVFSYLGTGQEVPDDLEVATPRHLAAYLIPQRPAARRLGAAGA